MLIRDEVKLELSGKFEALSTLDCSALEHNQLPSPQKYFLNRYQTVENKSV